MCHSNMFTACGDGEWSCVACDEHFTTLDVISDMSPFREGGWVVEADEANLMTDAMYQV